MSKNVKLLGNFNIQYISPIPLIMVKILSSAKYDLNYFEHFFNTRFKKQLA
jgi:hypothetical protein